MKTRNHSRKDNPYGITNAVLAFCLDLAGVEMTRPACVNRYTPGILFVLGGGEKDDSGNVTKPSRFAGMSIEAAALAAFEEGQPGNVYYRFQMTNKLSPLGKAFREQENTIKQGEKINTTELIKSITSKMVSGEMSEEEGIVRLACVILKLYIPFKNQWKQIAPEVAMNNPGKTREFETTVQTTDRKGNAVTVPAKAITTPGFKAWPVNLKEADRKRLKI